MGLPDTPYGFGRQTIVWCIKPHIRAVRSVHGVHVSKKVEIFSRLVSEFPKVVI